jgi:cell division protein FtsL
MSPVVQSRGKKITAADNLYTVVLAMAFLAVFATAVFVAYQCYTQYGTIFKIQ